MAPSHRERIREDALNVIITIEGREAVPVRAIPFLTNWEVLSPDELAQALMGEDVFTPGPRTEGSE